VGMRGSNRQDVIRGELLRREPSRRSSVAAQSWTRRPKNYRTLPCRRLASPVAIVAPTIPTNRQQSAWRVTEIRATNPTRVAIELLKGREGVPVESFPTNATRKPTTSCHCAPCAAKLEWWRPDFTSRFRAVKSVPFGSLPARNS